MKVGEDMNALTIYATLLASFVLGMAAISSISPRVYEDSLTGCEYIQTMFTMTPRIDSDGEPVCNEDVLK